MDFHIRHRTTYVYDRPVRFGDHRLMIRPRDGHDMRLLDSSLSLSPPADVHWAFDTFGNSVAHLSFHDPAEELVVESDLILRRYGVDEPLQRLRRYAELFPVRYSADERTDLAPYLVPEYGPDVKIVTAWVAERLPAPSASSLEVLEALGASIHAGIGYARREAMGVQSPAETIRLARGSCRDFALLFMEAARSLGFAARFVTGYLYDPVADPAANRSADSDAFSGGGATHAWADVFVPGVGWTEFDPTNRIIASRNLIRVAVTRRPAQSVPVSGTFCSEGGQFLRMTVTVIVRRASRRAGLLRDA